MIFARVFYAEDGPHGQQVPQKGEHENNDLDHGTNLALAVAWLCRILHEAARRDGKDAHGGAN